MKNDDLALADLRRCKFVIIPNCYHLTWAQRTLIRRTMLQGNRTVLWCYAAGLFHGAGIFIEAMPELTGLHLVAAENPERVRARIALTGEGAPVAAMTGSGQVIGHEHMSVRVLPGWFQHPRAAGRHGPRDPQLVEKHLQKWSYG